MSLNIGGTGGGYSRINTNSAQYKAAMRDNKSDINAAEAQMTENERLIYEMMGGREAHIRNVMSNYNSDGDYVGPGGIVVPGMFVGEGSSDSSQWQQMINISEDSRQKMFDNVKREFIQENGVSNGDTTKRSQIFREYQLSVKKEDRLKGTWSLQQYEGQYRSALYAAVKAANPSWKMGQSFDSSILDNITRETVEGTLNRNGNTLEKKSIDCTV